MLKIVHADCETTGRNPAIHSIHQLAGIIEIDGKTVETFDIKIRPMLGRQVDHEALKISRVTAAQIQVYPTFLDGIKKFSSILSRHCDISNPKDKFYISGYNSQGFDCPFIEALFEAAHMKTYNSWFWHSSLDTMVLAAHVLRYEREQMTSFSLETVAKRFDIDIDVNQLHTGPYDASISQLLYHKICNRLS